MKVKFLISPVSGYGLAYAVGAEADLKTPLATELIEKGIAEAVEGKTEKATAKKKTVKAVKK